MSQGVAALSPKETGFVKGLWISNAIVFALLTVGALVFGSGLTAVSVIVGGIIALANFRLAQSAIGRVLGPRATKVKAMGVVLFLYYLRFGATVAVLGVCIYQGWVEPFGLLLGLSVVVITIVTYGLIGSRKLG